VQRLALLDPSRTGREAEDLEHKLRNFVVGQDEAIHEIVRAYQTYVAGLSPVGRPIGNFLFLGPTGSGKTRIVEATAECLLMDSRAVIKIDCAEFQHSHEVAKLLGSPPGYLGHRETHALLSQEALDQYHTDKVKISFVLFDEIEKASDAVWNLLLGILDKATLTLGDNRKVDFSAAMVFMTSNLGATEMSWVWLL
jgi:ATP-dependent Clp protease ATP-binding subunit ClpA